MLIGAVASLLVIVCVFAALVAALLSPFGVIAAGVWLALRLFGPRTAPAATFASSIGENRRDDHRRIAWAVGLLVAGVLWIFGPFRFAALLVGAGAGLLTRGVLDLRRVAAR